LTDDVSALSASTVELVRRARQQLMNDFDRYGLELIDVKLHALILPDRAHAVWQRHTGTPDEPAGQGVEDTGERGPALTRVELASSAGVARLLPKMHIQTLPSDDGASAATSAENADVAGDEPTSGHCSGCEREAPAEAKFCPWCGQSLGGEA
jgi:membrane protease subunit (stomatin/prohibitin family)